MSLPCLEGGRQREWNGTYPFPFPCPDAMQPQDVNAKRITAC